MTSDNTNKFNDTYLQSLDKRLRELRREVEEGLGVYCNKPVRQVALANPNAISIEEAFDYMFDKYENALEELSEK